MNFDVNGRATLFLSICILASQIERPAAQLPQAPTPSHSFAAVSGTVLDAESGAAIAGAMVSLSGTLGVPGSAVLTDSHGRFVFTSLRPGFYTVSAQKIGFFDGVVGESEVPSVPFALRSGILGVKRLVLAEGQWFQDAVVRLHRPASISGRVVDEELRPADGRPVRVLQVPESPGDPFLLAGTAITDDRGEFSIGRLLKGRYVVAVLPFTQDGSPAITADGRVYPLTCANGGPSFSAALPVSVEYGQNLASVEIRLAPVQSRRVKGRLVGQATLTTGVTLALLPQGDPPMSSSSHVRVAKVALRDEFEFRDVPAGSYTIYVIDTSAQPSRNLQLSGGPARWRAPGEGTGSSELTLWGHVDVDAVAQDALDVSLIVHPLITVTGRVVDENQSPELTLPQMISLIPDGRNSGTMRSGTIQQDGSFQIGGLVPGAHFIDFPGTVTVGSASVQSVPLRGPVQLVVDQAPSLEVVLTSGSQLFGHVDVANSISGEPFSVVYFPDDPLLWAEFTRPETKSGRVGVKSDGSYETQIPLPPGRYRVIALPDSTAAAWQSEPFRRQAMTQATTVDVSRGARVRLDLRPSTLIVR